LSYTTIVKTIRWNSEKNLWLIHHRGVCFEQVLLLFERGELLDIVEHPNAQKYPGQKEAVVAIGDYAYVVPFVEDEEEVFLKTIIPSRKATAKYLRGKQ
jgi:uncharacterized DUF497 family protein